MTPHLSMAALVGFVIVFALSLARENPLSTSLIRGLIGALAFVIIYRWWIRKVFTELHHSMYEQSQAEMRANEARAAEAQASAQPPTAA